MPSWPLLPPWRQGCLICLWISRTTTAFIFYLTLNWLQFCLTSVWQTGNWDNPGADLWVNRRYLPWGQLCLSVGWESWVGVVKAATDWFIFGTSYLLRALRGGISSLMTYFHPSFLCVLHFSIYHTVMAHILPGVDLYDWNIFWFVRYLTLSGCSKQKIILV